MPRLVIHEHREDEQNTHYDLMLESPQMQSLWTWRFRELPGSAPGQQCQRIQDHDARFLTYEGPLTVARGSVRIVERGTFDLLSDQDADPDKVFFTARGHVVAGTCRIVRGDNEVWSFTCEPENK